MVMEDPTWLEHRVSYGETDAMSVMYYANYLHLFERGRNALFRRFGISYNEMEKDGYFLPVSEASCRYRSPARYDDLLHLATVISEWGRASAVCSYELYNEDKSRLLATGFTRHALVGTDGKPRAVPGWLKEKFGVGA